MVEIKTLGELNKEGMEAYCRGCYSDNSECPKCFWNTEKWLKLPDTQTNPKDLGDMINATIAIQQETGVNLLPYPCEKVNNVHFQSREEDKP